jgi:hypothetical protein
MSHRLRLFIFGSCVSRDVLSIDGADQHIDLVGYFSRTSLASQTCPPLPREVMPEISAAPFLKRMAQADMGKICFAAIEAAAFDILLLDIIDNRFPLIERNGRYFMTATPEALGAISHAERGRLVRDGEEEYLRLWEQGFCRLLRLLEAKGAIDTLRVNRVYWADECSGPFAGIARDEIPRANALLEAKYRRMETVLDTSVFYTYPREYLSADASHSWGYAPFHYRKELYAATLQHLLRDRPDGNVNGADARDGALDEVCRG